MWRKNRDCLKMLLDELHFEKDHLSRQCGTSFVLNTPQSSASLYSSLPLTITQNRYCRDTWEMSDHIKKSAFIYIYVFSTFLQSLSFAGSFQRRFSLQTDILWLIYSPGIQRTFRMRQTRYNTDDPVAFHVLGSKTLRMWKGTTCI